MKTTLLKNLFLAIALIVNSISFGQIDLTFASGDEGFVAASGGTSGSASGGIYTLTTSTGTNSQLRRNGTDIGDPTTLTTFIIDLKNNSNCNQIALQTSSGGVTTVATQAITTADSSEKSYRIDVPGTAATWVGTFQLRLRFVISGGGSLDGNTIEINRIQIVDPGTLAVKENTLEGVRLFSNLSEKTLSIKSLEGGEIALYNILGVKVKSEETSAKEYKMYVSDLSAGIYIFKLVHQGKFFTRKFIVK